MRTYKPHISSFSCIVIFTLLVIIGLSLSIRVPVSQNPNRGLQSITIQYGYQGAPAEVVEKEVTNPLEGAISTIPGIKNLRSESYAGNGRIIASFDQEVNMQMKRHEIATLIRRLYPDFPEEVSFPEIRTGGRNDDENRAALLTYNLLSTLDHSDIEQISRYEIVDRISGIEGVRNVELNGIPLENWEISFDYNKLTSLGLSTLDIRNTFNLARTRLFLGNVKTVSNEYGIVVESRIKDVYHIENLTIGKVDGRVIKISDIASVERKKEAFNHEIRVNGASSIVLQIFAESGINQLKLASTIREKISEIQEKIGYDIQIMLRRDASVFLAEEVNIIVRRTLLTLAILLGFVWITHRSIKYTLTILISLVASLSISFLFYYLLDVELHLFSFAGITISFGILIDNVIIMLDHFTIKSSKKVFLAIFASTLTTVAALSIVNFLDERTREQLLDFVIVVMINLSVSLVVSLFLIPALAEIFKLDTKNITSDSPMKHRLLVRLNQLNEVIIVLIVRRKKWLFVLLVLSFGLPIFNLPTRLQGNTEFTKLYNQTFGSPIYINDLKPHVDLILGGALRGFMNRLASNDLGREQQETVLNVVAQMPSGSSFEQTSQLISQVEQYLKNFKEIAYFETEIGNPEFARVDIYFKDQYQKTNLPARLMDRLQKVVTTLGSAEWQISGAGDGFNNSTMEQNGRNQIYLYGYSYKELRKYANKVLEGITMFPRVDNATITSRRSAFRQNSFSYMMQVDPSLVSRNSLNVSGVVNSFGQQTLADRLLGQIPSSNMGNNISVYLSSKDRKKFDMWQLKNSDIGNEQFLKRMNSVGTLMKQQDENGIFKINQQYQLVVNFDFIGSSREADDFLENRVKAFKKKVPLGFEIRTRRISRRPRENKIDRNWFIVFAVLSIYFICAILLESFLQPLAVIIMIPISFIGAFLAFTIADVEFGQGGYASFLLLSGLTVNSAIYIINDINIIRKKGSPGFGKHKFYLKTYQKAFNQKIASISLTLLSTILGMLPFMITENQDIFWFSLALGTIGGLTFSLIAIYFYLPLFFITSNSLKK